MTEAATASGAESAPAAIPQPQKREFVPPQKAQPEKSLPKTKGESSSDELPPWKTQKHRVKVEGKELDVGYDELVQGYQKAHAAQRRFEEAKRIKDTLPDEVKTARGIQSALERGDLSFLSKQLGREKAKQLMEDYLIQEMEEESLKRENPGEFRARELEKKLKEKEQKEAEDKKKAEEKALEEARTKAHEDLDKEVGEALEKLGRKPTPRLVIRIIDEMIARLDSKEKDIPASEAAEYALKGIYADISEYLPQLETEELVKVLPPEVIERIRKHQVEQVLGEKSQRRTKPSSSAQKTEKKVGVDDWFKNLDKKFK